MSQVIESLAGASGERAGDRGAIARRLLSELVPFRKALVGAFGLIVFNAVTQAIGPLLIGLAIDREIGRGDRRGLVIIIAILVVLYAAGMFATRAQVRQVGRIGQEILASLRLRLFDHFHRLPTRFFDRRPVGDLMSRVTSDVETLNQFLSQGVTQLLGSFFSLIGIIIAMLLVNWRLALACYLIIPLMLLTTTAFARRARQAFRTARETTGDITAGIQEEISGIREAQAFNRTEQNIVRFRRRNAANRAANVSAVGITSGFAPAMDVLSTLATAIVIGYGGLLVFDDRLTVGLLTAFLIYVQQFFRPIQLASQVYTQAQSSLAASERIYGILDEPGEVADRPGAIEIVPDEVRGELTFDGVTFGYETDRPVLHGLSFTIGAGETVALVGPTGAGKTTIANLVPRFYDPDAGRVLLDGRDLRDLTRASLRRQIAIVLQEPFLFSGTVAANIAFGRPDASRSEVEAAAAAVDADRFIRDLPEGYDTPLGERGSGLSEGQRQLLSLARALLADPRILILDEATSRVDTRTEATIQRALASVLEGRTSIVIAHRLSTVRDADRILVVSGGTVVEQGTHDGLLARDGAYADLYRRQFRTTGPVPGLEPVGTPSI
ncbi:MAG: Lipid A export ATP-binding/permease protein MsbA [uncultured Thermomicrobiales bacterium]|uniref:Lipid A export ATP-binding/permease protein MsbA n=1 Tax=uncultured Thermomicrobiales bacterium TaxID=1645740 RepID=A0A6J4UYJ8_9BACT|nr:MAG: Lipid A export ATP-binding/permease protein MsbA [uncultured Thermomicrobiales bacterium]